MNTPLIKSFLKPGRWLLLLFGACIAVLISIAVLFAQVFKAGAQPVSSPQMPVIQPNNQDIVGDLGGMKVTIPRHMVELVEYDGDPGWGGKRQGPIPVRTHDSKLMSFGFVFRYPDMATLSSNELREDYRRYTAYKSQWIKIGIRSGEIYPKDGWLDRVSRSYLQPDEELKKFWDRNYERLPDLLEGLEHYEVKGINPQTGKAYRDQFYAPYILFKHDENGRARTYIKCRTPPETNRHYWPCEQYWSLEWQGLKIEMQAIYTRHMLPNWADIEAKATQMVMSWKLPEAAVKPEAAASTSTASPNILAMPRAQPQ